MNTLVLCTGNSARSIMLESLLNRLSNGRVTAYSAGSSPSGTVHPQSLFLLDSLGFDTDILRSKNWGEFTNTDAPPMNLVITVCGSAAGEPCPIWPGTPLRAHWGVEDPASTDQADWEVAFQTVFDQLKRRALAFLDQPFETMHPPALTTALNKIGALS